MEILQSAQYPEYLAFCEKMGAHFMQIPNWGQVKSGWESEILVQREAGEICAGVLLLRRKVGPFCLLYAPRGPVCDLEHLEGLMEDVLPEARSAYPGGAARVCRPLAGIGIHANPSRRYGKHTAEICLSDPNRA